MSAIRVNRGEPLVLPITLTLDGHDWTGVTVSAAVFVRKPGVTDQTPTLAMDAVVADAPLTGSLSLSTEQTDELPDKCFLWVRAQRTSPAWGPYTSDAIELDVRDPGEPGAPSVDVTGLTIAFTQPALDLTFPVSVDRSLVNPTGVSSITMVASDGTLHVYRCVLDQFGNYTFRRTDS